MLNLVLESGGKGWNVSSYGAVCLYVGNWGGCMSHKATAEGCPGHGRAHKGVLRGRGLPFSHMEMGNKLEEDGSIQKELSKLVND